MNQEEKKLLIQELTQEKEEHSKTIQQLQEKTALIDKLNENQEKLQKALEETQKNLLQTQKRLAEEKKKNNGSSEIASADLDNRDSNAQQKLNFLMKGNEELKIENAKLKIQLQQSDKEKEKLQLELSATKQSLEEAKKLCEEEKFNSELGNVTIDSLQRQLADLRKQQQARGIQTFDDEIERLQFNEFQQEVLGESFQASPIRPSRAQESIPPSIEEHNPELLQLKMENAQLKEQLQEEKQNSDAAWESINNLKNDKNHLSSIIEEQLQQIEQLNQQLLHKETQPQQQNHIAEASGSTDASILMLQTKLNRKEKQIQTLRTTMENSAKQQQANISVLQANIRNLTEQRDALQQKLMTSTAVSGSNQQDIELQTSTLTRENNQLRRELTELSSANESLKQQISKYDGEINAFKQQVAFLQDSLEELQSKQTHLAQARTTEAQSLSSLQQEIENQRSRNSLLELEKDKLLLQVKSISKEMEDAVRRIRQELETEKQAHALTEKQLQQEQNREQQTATENRSLQHRISELEKNISLLKDASTHETEEVTDLKNQITELERFKSQLQAQAQELNVQLEIEKKNTTTLKLQIEKLTKSLEATQQQLAKVTASFEQERNTYNGDMELLRSQLNDERLKNSQLQEQIEKDKISMELASIDSLKHQIGELKKVYENDLDFDIGSMNLSLDGFNDSVQVGNSAINGGI